MISRSKLLMVTTAAAVAWVVSACGGDDAATEKQALDTRSAGISISPTSPTDVPAEAEIPVVDGSAVESTTAPLTETPARGVSAGITTPPQPAPVVTDSPEPQGSIGIWTNEDDYIPLTGAAFDVQSCGENTGGGHIDMAAERYAAMPVSLGCWVVSLTRSPAGYVLNGPAQRTVVLDQQTTDVNVTYRFTA